MKTYPSNNQLVASSVACERGGRVLFKDTDLRVNSGQALIIQGQNGAGKTSLLRIITGLSPPSDGHVRWNDQDITQIEQEFQQNLCYIGHLPAVKRELSVRENLQLLVKLWPHENACEIPELAEKVGLRKRLSVPCSRLSAGQLRRVSLARLFISTQCLWVLDEPLTALDVDFIASIEQQLQLHLSNGGLLVLTTHRGIDLGNQEVATLPL